MQRKLAWTVVLVVVGMFALAGAWLGEDGQRTWALASTMAVIGAALIGGIYLAIGMLSRWRFKAQRLVPRAFRRR